jgi:hypothetical protein
MRSIGVYVAAIVAALVVYVAALIGFALIGIEVRPSFPEWITVGLCTIAIGAVHRAFEE